MIHCQGESEYVSIGIVLVNVDLVREPNQMPLQLFQLTRVVSVIGQLPLTPLLLVPKFWYGKRCPAEIEQQKSHY